MKRPWLYFSAALAAAPLFAQPEGCQVRAGSAELSALGDTLSVATSDRAVLEWEAFSIGANEKVRFDMPSVESAVLNRVVGNHLSEIYGALESNGQVFLINPRGVLFGKDAQIDTWSFIASTLGLNDGDFLKGGELLFGGDSQEPIVNLGSICAAGDVFLIAASAKNEGNIIAGGAAGIGAGSEVLLRPHGSERFFVRVESVEAIAKTDGNPYTFAIQDSGCIDALGSSEREGRVYLVAGNGNVSASGAYAARDEVRVLGVDVRLEEGAEVAAPTVLIGGDYQGKNPEIPNARVAYVAPSAKICADGESGGKVIVWGNAANGFFGAISARGVGGDGGFVEVSSPGYLAFEGNVDTRSVFGKAGTLLLDPCAVTISTSATTSGVTFSSGSYSFGTLTAANIQASALISNLSSGNVTVNASGSGDATTGTITLNAALSWSSAHTLTLEVSNTGSTITIGQAVTSSGSGGLTCTASGSGSTITIGGTTTAEHVTLSGSGALVCSATGSGSSISVVRAIDLTGSSASATLTVSGGNNEMEITKTGSINLNENSTLAINASSAGSTAPSTVAIMGPIIMEAGPPTSAQSVTITGDEYVDITLLNGSGNTGKIVGPYGTPTTLGPTVGPCTATIYGGNLTLTGSEITAVAEVALYLAGDLTLTGVSGLGCHIGTFDGPLTIYGLNGSGGSISLDGNGYSCSLFCESPANPHTITIGTETVPLQDISITGGANILAYGDLTCYFSGTFTLNDGYIPQPNVSPTTPFEITNNVDLIGVGPYANVMLTDSEILVYNSLNIDIQGPLVVQSNSYITSYLPTGTTTITAGGISVTESNVRIDGSFPTIINCNGNFTVEAISTSPIFTAFNANSGLNITCNDLTLDGAGRGVNLSSNAEMSILANGLVLLESGGNINTATGGDLTIRSIGLTQSGLTGSPTGGNSIASGGSLIIDGYDSSHSGPIILETLYSGGGALLGCNNTIQIGQTPGYQPPTYMSVVGESGSSITVGDCSELEITLLGDLSLTGAPDCYLAFAGITDGISITLNDGGNLILNGNANEGGVSIDGSGAFNFNVSGDISLTDYSFITTDGAISIQSTSLTLNGTDDPTPSTTSDIVTYISSTGAGVTATIGSGGITLTGSQTVPNTAVLSCDGTMGISTTGALTMTGGANISNTGSNAATITIQSVGLSMTDGTSTAATITNSKGSISIDGTVSSSGAIALMGTNGGGVSIAATGTGNGVNIGQTGGTIVPTALTLQASTASNAILESANSTITVTTGSGGISLTGPSTGSNQAKITADGSMSLASTGAVSLTGGATIVNNGSNAAPISIQSVGLSMTDGTSTAATISSSQGTISIDGTVSSSGAIALMGTNGGGVSIAATGTGNGINIGQTGGTIVPTALTLQGGAGAAAITTNGATAPIEIKVSGDMSLTGGSGASSSAEILAQTAGEISLTSESGDITLTGGSGTNAAAKIVAISGDISLTGNNGSFSGPTSTANSAVQTMGSDLTMTFSESATFSGYTTLSTPATGGNLLIIAGVNITIEDDVTISALGTTSLSSLTLVCDNDFPTSPSYGPGQFNLLGTSVILETGSGSAPLRIFTAQRSQNTITGDINSEPFIPGPIEVDSPTEMWGVYYPSSLGGDPYTLFYKFPGGQPPPPPTPTPSHILSQAVINAIKFKTAFTSAQGMFEFDSFYFFDWYRWSFFLVEKKGRAIRRLDREEMLRNIGPRGFAL